MGLPMQALDHATGYLLAAAAIRGLTRRLQTRVGCEARTSLARIAALLVSTPAEDAIPDLAAETRMTNRTFQKKPPGDWPAD
jgi:hypothetical protein